MKREGIIIMKTSYDLHQDTPGNVLRVPVRFHTVLVPVLCKVVHLRRKRKGEERKKEMIDPCLF